MGQKLPQLNERLIKFIQQQQIYFVATADTDGRVNVSPKGLDSFKVLNEKQVMWLNLTGSGNETATHVQSCPRMTIMFNDFVDKPMILRLYGQAKVIHINDEQWQQHNSQFKEFVSARQIFVMDIEMVQTSCGMAVPLFDFKQQRDALLNSKTLKGKEKLHKYWQDKNQISIDGKPTNIVEKNL